MFQDAPMAPAEREAGLRDERHESLLAQLRNDIRTEVARDLLKFRAREAEFDAIDTGELFSIYLNWKHRQIHPHRREVVYSNELSQRIQTDDGPYVPVKSEFSELVRITTVGEDLLSSGLLSPGVVRKPYELEPDYLRLNREGHLDLLLNEQGIHHLHLPGLERKKNAPIVFTIFEPRHAFLLDLARHDDYQTDRLARISYENWPERHFHRLPIDALMDGEGNEIDLKDQQRISVRNSAINTPIKIADRFYVMPRSGGVAANGFAHFVVRLSNRIWNSLSLFAIRRYRPRFDEYFLENTGKRLPDDPTFRFQFRTTETDWGYAIVEERSGCGFLLPNNFGVSKTT
jgi:hypothetical protein